MALRAIVSVVIGFSGAAQSVKADLTAECRQEAEHYAVPPELLDDYIAGCVVSRGGVHASDVAEDEEEEAILSPTSDTATEPEEIELEEVGEDAEE